MSVNQDSNLMPGVTDTDFSIAHSGYWGRPEWRWIDGAKRILGSARDAGNTPNTILRPGLLMGVVTATKSWKEWNQAATDGSQYIRGILRQAMDTQRRGANADHLVGYVDILGAWKASQILIPGETTYGIIGKDLEFMVRDGVNGRFLLDDYQAGELRRRTITADATLDYNDHGAIIDNLGDSNALVLTLPTPRRGLRFTFMQVAGQQITLNSSATNEFLPPSGTPANSHVIANTNYARVQVEGISNTLYVVSDLTAT